jgi:Coenzyme PQQ synthesis protein D (PqqD)
MRSEQLRLRKDTVDWREIDGQIIALDAEKSSYLAANVTGAILWKALVEGTTRTELIQILVREFEIDRTRAEDDVDRFLAQLVDAGLLEE